MPRKKTPAKPSKKCVRCNKEFNDDMVFITCPSCRSPLKSDGGGCHRWTDLRSIGEMIVATINGNVFS